MKIIRVAALSAAAIAVGMLFFSAVSFSASTPVAPNPGPTSMAQRSVPSIPRPGIDVHGEHGNLPGRYIVVLEDSVAHPGSVAETQTAQRDGDLGYVYRSAIKGYSAKLSKGAVETLREDPRVKYIAPDGRVEGLSQTVPTGVKRIYAFENTALDIDETDDIRVNADVAVIDSGVDYTHPDLNVYSRTDCVPANEEEWQAANCVDNSGTDGVGHGTHVAGTVGALDNGFGVVGVAPGARIWSVRVLGNQNYGYNSWIIAGIDWVTARASQIEVANMSLGGPGESRPMDEAIEASVESGVVYAVAAMNDDLNAKRGYPANSPDVITVSALADSDGKPGGEGEGCGSHLDDTLAGFSNWGSEVEIAAPGACIYSTWKGGGYEYLSGTSMATPHVAGAAAILASQSNPNSKGDVYTIRQTLVDGGNLDWFDTSEDTRTEPLLYAGDKPLQGIEAATSGWNSTSPTTATLYGSVNLRGNAASYQFEYGPTDKYGSTAAPLKETWGPAVSQALTNLQPDQTYHYRLYLKGSNGVQKYGKDHTFKTSRWTVQSAGAPTHTSSEWLNDISCPSPTACMAVGHYYDINTSPWNLLGSYARSGGNWIFHSIPAPAASEGNYSELVGVSCSAADGCSAVGSYENAGGVVTPLVERWNGSSWTRESLLPPKHAKYTALSDVSCPSSTECIAVGYYLDETETWLNYSARWKNGTWSALTTANPPSFSHSFMEGVSCASPTSCVAVGWWVSGGSPALRLIAEWNGSSWSFQTPDQDQGELLDVDCRSKSACVIVGNGNPERWDGSKWVEETYSGPSSTYSDLNSVSCASPTSCTAIGSYWRGGRFRTQAVIWDGVAWRENQLLVRQNAEARERLYGVSCVAGMGCNAVGESNAFIGNALIETRPNWQPAIAIQTPEIGANFAKLHFTVDPQGYETTYHYEMGKTTSYEYGQLPYPDKSIGSGTSPVSLEGEIPALAPKTTYHYRIVATNGEGTTYTPDQTFTTIGNPKASLEAPTEIGTTSAVLRGKVNPDGGVTKYHFEYGTEWEPEGLKYKTPEQTLPAGESYVPVSAPISGLSPYTQYQIYLVATSIGGSGAANSSFWTLDPPPVAETGAASEITGRSAVLSGTVDPEGVATKYSFQYGTSIPGTSHSPEVSVGSGTEPVPISQEVAPLTPNTTYYYRLNATNPAAGHGEYKSFTTTDGKPKVTIESATAVKAGKATLNAKVNSGGFATHYYFEWGTTTSYGKTIPAPPGALAYGEYGEKAVARTIEGLKGETTYHYRVVAENANGTATSADQTFTTPVWHPTIGYQAPVSITTSEATLTAGINPNSFATSYRFEWGPTAAYGNSIPVPDKEIGSGETEVKASQAISGLKPSTEYHFRVVASNAEGTVTGADKTFRSATFLHWFACTEQTGGRYSSNKCTTEGGTNKWESLKLKEGEKANITAIGKPITFSATFAGIKGSLFCETEVTGATLENPSGGANGTGNADVKYKGCKAEGIWGEKGCKVTPAAAVATKLDLVTIEGKAQAALTPKSGENLASYTFAECTVPALNGTWALTGTFRGLYSNAASQIEFNAETTAEGLKLRGTKATAVGGVGLEASGGAYIRANDAPVAITEAASAVKPTEATLNGTVNPEGAATTYQFEYGKTTSYGQKAPVEAKAAGEGIADVKVAETLKELLPGTTYHYRLMATNGTATGYGADKTFTTAVPPLNWFACTKQTGGKYKDGKCATEGSPNEWESLKLKEGEKTNITAKGKTIAFSATFAGINGTLSCETEVTNASLENPSGGANGTGNADVKYKGCKGEGGWGGKSCKITPAAAVATKLDLVTIEGKAQVALTPKSGENLASYTFAECTVPALNGTWALTGTFRGLYSNAASQIEFNAETTAEGLKLRGTKATAVGSIGLETTAGGYLKAQ